MYFNSYIFFKITKYKVPNRKIIYLNLRLKRPSLNQIILKIGHQFKILQDQDQKVEKMKNQSHMSMD